MKPHELYGKVPLLVRLVSIMLKPLADISFYKSKQ